MSVLMADGRLSRLVTRVPDVTDFGSALYDTLLNDIFWGFGFVEAMTLDVISSMRTWR
jgi:hypothetical protein